jgi:hypothetical protein
MKLNEVPNVKEDFSMKGYDIVPVANPENVVSMQKFAKAQFLMGFINSPYVEQNLLHRTVFETAGIENFDKFIIQPQPQPDPAVQMATLQEETRRMEIQSKTQIEAAKLELEQMKLQRQSAETDSKVLVNYAQAGKLVKDTEMAESREKLDVLDNIIDAESRKSEMQDRKQDRRFRAAVELAKLENQQVKIPSTEIELEE